MLLRLGIWVSSGVKGVKALSCVSGTEENYLNLFLLLWYASGCKEVLERFCSGNNWWANTFWRMTRGCGYKPVHQGFEWADLCLVRICSIFAWQNWGSALTWLNLIYFSRPFLSLADHLISRSSWACVGSLFGVYCLLCEGREFMTIRRQARLLLAWRSMNETLYIIHKWNSRISPS